jgi:hypothetical protein
MIRVFHGRRVYHRLLTVRQCRKVRLVTVTERIGPVSIQSRSGENACGGSFPRAGVRSWSARCKRAATGAWTLLGSRANNPMRNA